MNRPGGWTRIGVVISILWSLAVIGFAASEYWEFSKERKDNLSLPAPPKHFVVIKAKAEALFFEWQPVDLFAKGISAHVRDFKLQGSRLLIVWLSPIIVLWVFSFILVITFKWVRAGFSKRPNIGS